MVTQSVQHCGAMGLGLRRIRTIPLVSATPSRGGSGVRSGSCTCGSKTSGCTFDSKQEPDALVAHVRVHAGA